jgi:putative transposase
VASTSSTLVLTCIVHLIRASLNFVNWKERKAMAADLKPIYRAATAEMVLAKFRVKYRKHQEFAESLTSPIRRSFRHLANSTCQ